MDGAPEGRSGGENPEEQDPRETTAGLRPGSNGGIRILLVEDDVVATMFMVDVLGTAGGYTVGAVSDPREALALVEAQDWDIVVTDLVLPYLSGLDVIREVRARRPGIGVIVTSGQAGMNDAVAALRLQADDFMVKPVVPADLLARVAELAALQRARRHRQVALAVGAHPDDIEIGAGGTLLSHRERGDAVAVLIMSGGERGGVKKGRAAEAAAAADLLGAQLFVERLEDTRIPESGQSVAIVEDVIAEVGATVIYTHSAHDRHQDHRSTHGAVMIAARNVPRVYCYQSPSCTIDFRPTRFEAIDKFVTAKLRLIGCHASQASSRKYLEEDLIVSMARYWGWFGGSRYAEPFEVARDVQGAHEMRPASIEVSMRDIEQIESSRGR